MFTALSVSADSNYAAYFAAASAPAWEVVISNAGELLRCVL